MKKLYISLILVCFFPSISLELISAKTDSQVCIQDAEKSSDKIALRGSLKPQGSLRSGGDALIAEIQGNIIQIVFLKYVGNVSITIENETGMTVFSTVVDSNNASVIIPIGGLLPGSYTITFDNNISTMWGDFEI